MTTPNPWLKPLLSITEAADLLGCDRATAYRSVKAGKLPVVDILGAARIRTVDLLSILGLPVPALESA